METLQVGVKIGVAPPIDLFIHLPAGMAVAEALHHLGLTEAGVSGADARLKGPAVQR